ncbi:MAG TPA: DUF2341 domain-containing protein [Fibrobacteria bacterium]|nr:DUF2341 domain-containing protein [Fibrobacteria bacterium]
MKPKPISARLARALLGSLAILAGTHCTESPTEALQGGGGSEAVALVGSFEYPDHKPAMQASVRLRPRLFLSDTAAGAAPAAGSGTVLDAVTDSQGAFRMDSVKRGDYFLEIRDSASHGLLIPCTLTGDSTVVRLEAAALRPTGAVTGSIVAPEGFAGRTYVQVYGLDRQVKTDSATGRFRMDGLPQGTYTLRAVYSAPAVDPREIDSVAAYAADTTDIGAVRLASFENENYAAWPRSRRLYVNTTASGANVAGNVDDFPLLVRLTKDNFDFSAGRGGRDVRFADAKGKRLRYEVERWDSAAAVAELWVRLDRVNGNSNSQFITMHWGLPGAEDIADSRMVFGADAGFAGVWHLGESEPDTVSADLYRDAVGYDPAADRVASSGRDGVVGYGAAFEGDDYIAVPVANPLLQPNAMVSVSAWMKASRTSVLGGNILSMGDSYTLRVNPNGTGRFSFFNGEMIGVETPKTVNLLDSAWHHLAATYDGSALSLYVDGKLSARAAAKGSLDYRFWPAFVMGRHGNRKPGYDFHGSLDQVEVSGETARSADWIKLAYENQRTGSKLVEFRP